MPDLTRRQVFEKLGDRRQVFKELHREMEWDELLLRATATEVDATRVRRGTWFTGFPKLYRLKLLPIATDVVDTGINAIMIGEDPQITVLLPASDTTANDKLQTSKKTLEGILTALQWRVNTYSSEPVLRGFLQHTIGYGMGILAYPLIMERWPQHPYPRKAKDPKWNPQTPQERRKVGQFDEARMEAFPFDVHTVHPQAAFWDPDNDPIEDMIEEQPVRLSAFADRYPHLNLGRGAQKTAKLVTYCSAKWYGMWLNERPLLLPADGANDDGIAPNPTGILWYKLARGGSGLRTYNGEWQYAIKGLLRDGRDMIIAKITDFNVMEAMRSVGAFPPLGFEGDTKEQADLESADFTYGPAEKWTHSRGVKAHVVDTPQVPQVVFQQSQELDRAMGVHFGPYDDAMRGAYRAEPASSLRTRIQQGKASYFLAQQNAQQAWAGMLQDICHYVKFELQDTLHLPYKTGGIDLKPADIITGMRIVVDFSPPTKEDKAQVLQGAVEQHDKGLMSTRKALELNPDIDDVDVEEERIISDELLKLPPVQQALAAAVMAKYGAQQPAPDGSTASPGAPGPVPGPAPAQQVGPGGPVLQGQQPPPPVLGGGGDMAQLQAGANRIPIPQLQ